MEQVVDKLVGQSIPCLDAYDVYDDYNKAISVQCYVETRPGNKDTYQVLIFDDVASLDKYYKRDCTDLEAAEEVKEILRGENWSMNPSGWTGSADIPAEDFQKALGGTFVSKADLAKCSS